MIKWKKSMLEMHFFDPTPKMKHFLVSVTFAILAFALLRFHFFPTHFKNNINNGVTPYDPSLEVLSPPEGSPLFTLIGSDSNASISNQPYYYVINTDKIVAIGDVHGQLYKLQSLWENLQKEINNVASKSTSRSTAASTTTSNEYKRKPFDDYVVVFLGDYVDRGPKIRETIDWLVNLKQSRPNNTVFLTGNHDLALAAFLGLLEPPKGFHMNSTWLDYKDSKDASDLWTSDNRDEINAMHLQGRRYGASRTAGAKDFYSSKNTFLSYGAQPGDRDALLRNMPQSHKEFFSSLAWVAESPCFILVHGGLDPAKPIDEQLRMLRERDLRHARVGPLHDRHMLDLGGHPASRKCIVSGHVPQAAPKISQKRILIDTTGGKKGNLSAVILPSRKVVQSSVLKVDD